MRRQLLVLVAASTCACSGPDFDVVAGSEGASHGYTVVGDDQHLFVGTETSILRLSLDGSEPAAIATGQAAVDQLYLQDGNLYWRNSGSTPTAQSGTFMLAAGSMQPTVIDSSFSGSLFVDGSGVYWSENDDEYGGEIERLGADGQTEVMLATGTSTSIGLVGDADFLYWLAADGTLARLPKAGGAFELLPATRPGAAYMPSAGPDQMMAVDSAYIYWLAQDLAGQSFAIVRVRKDGSAPIEAIVAPSSHVIGNLVVDPDGQALYWVLPRVADEPGALMRLDLGTPGAMPAPFCDDTDPWALWIRGDTVYWTTSRGVAFKAR